MAAWQYWLVVAAWIGWEIYWGLSARGVKRAASKEPLPSRLLVVVALILCFVFLLVPNWFGSFLDGSFLPQGGLCFYIGFALLLAGMAFTAWARTALGRNWSGRVTIKEDHELVTTGPYGLVRHPIYTGALLAIIGSVIALGRVGGLLSIVLILAVFIRKIYLEEQVLGRHFGARYTEYRKQTRALIPFLF